LRKIEGLPTDDIIKFIGNTRIDVANAFPVKTYRKLVEQIAKLSYVNKDHLLFFRGQSEDYRNKGNSSTFYPTIYRGDYLQRREVIHKFDLLNEASRQLKESFANKGISGNQELARKRYIQWSILQHYSVCDTPLLDLTHSLRVACSFAQLFATDSKAYVFVFGLPYITNRISINSEHDLVNIRLLSISPPDALRPYFQEGFLAGTEDITIDYSSKDELDFNNRLIAKFEIPNERDFWGSGFSKIPHSVLFPKGDKVQKICEEIKLELKHELLPGELGDFMKEWTDLESVIMESAQMKGQKIYSIRNAINILTKSNKISQDFVISINKLHNFRNLVVHEPKKVTSSEIEENIREIRYLKVIFRNQTG